VILKSTMDFLAELRKNNDRVSLLSRLTLCRTHHHVLCIKLTLVLDLGMVRREQGTLHSCLDELQSIHRSLGSQSFPSRLATSRTPDKRSHSTYLSRRSFLKRQNSLPLSPRVQSFSHWTKRDLRFLLHSDWTWWRISSRCWMLATWNGTTQIDSSSNLEGPSTIEGCDQ